MKWALSITVVVLAFASLSMAMEIKQLKDQVEAVGRRTADGSEYERCRAGQAMAHRLDRLDKRLTALEESKPKTRLLGKTNRRAGSGKADNRLIPYSVSHPPRLPAAFTRHVYDENPLFSRSRRVPARCHNGSQRSTQARLSRSGLQGRRRTGSEIRHLRPERILRRHSRTNDPVPAWVRRNRHGR